MQVANTAYTSANTTINLQKNSTQKSFNNLFEKKFAEFERQNPAWWQNTKINTSSQTSYAISVSKTQVSFKEGIGYFSYLQNTKTPFLDAVSQIQPAVSEAEYNQAINNIKDLMDNIVSFVIAEQGANSELGFNLDQMNKNFTLQMISNSIKLDMLKNQIQNYDGNDELIINTMQSYFTFGGEMATHYIAKFFDYASDKVEGLPTAQIIKDLSVVKGYWDNNKEQGFDVEGKRLSLSQIFDKKTKLYKTSLNIEDIEFNSDKLNSISEKIENEKLQILFGIFEKRDNLNIENNNLSKNSSLNSNKDSNSSNSILKTLLQDLASDENSLKDLKV